MKKIRQYILEASLGTVYHYTSIHSLQHWLDTGKIPLTSAARVGGDDGATGRKELFFLSTTRSKTGGYHSRAIGNYGVLVELDYDFLRNNYKIAPIDYWGRNFRLADQKTNEMEERLFSDKPFIEFKNASSLIKAVHILVRQTKRTKEYFTDEIKVEKEPPDKRMNVALRQVLISAKSKKIPTYVYGEPKYWMAMRPQFALTVEQLKEYISGPEEQKYQGMPRKSWLAPYYELYMKPTKHKDTLSDKAKRIVRNLEYYNGFDREPVTQFESDLHNEMKSTYTRKILPLIKKHGGTKGFIQFIADKWKRK